MSTTPTLVGPTRTQQINNTLYVGGGYLHTIQQAVNFAVANGGVYRIVIPSSYTGSEAIDSIVNGEAQVYLVDERLSQTQTYSWSGTAYTPAGLHEMGDIECDGAVSATDVNVSHEINFPGGSLINEGNYNLILDPTPDPSGTILLNWNNGGGRGTQFGDGNSNPVATVDGEGNITCIGDIDCDGMVTAAEATISDVLTAGAVRALTDPLGEPPRSAQMSYNTPNETGVLESTGPDTATEAGIILAGWNSDHTQHTNYLVGTPSGIDMTAVPVSVDALTAENITANDAAFETCEVAGSPVRTFANTSVGMVYPSPGVAVSAGGGWGQSIAQSTLAFVNKDNVFQTQQSFVPNNNISGIQAQGSGLTVGYNLRGNGETDFVNAGGGATSAFNWYNVAPNTKLDNTVVPLMTMDYTGTLRPAAALVAGGAVVATGSSSTIPIPATASQVYLSCDSNKTQPRVGMVCSTAPVDQKVSDVWVDASGTIHHRLFDDARSVANDWLTVVRNGAIAQSITLTGETSVAGDLAVSETLNCTGVVNAGQGLIVTDPTAAITRMTLGVNGNSGTRWNGQFLIGTANPTDFNSYNQQFIITRYAQDIGESNVFVLDGGGNLNITGAMNAAQKNFRIIDPLDPTKLLWHSSLEGPEVAVFYRGEAVTDEQGTATITLPDYFEALTLPQGRTVLLTTLFEDDDVETEIGRLAAGRVKDGAFRVRSEYASQAFYWEVKAVRSDVPPLVVVTDIPVVPVQRPVAPLPQRPTDTAPTGKKNGKAKR